MIWRIGRPVTFSLVGAEFWAMTVDNRQLLHLFAILALGVLAVCWVLTVDDKRSGR